LDTNLGRALVEAKMIIVDEVSMLSAKAFDAADDGVKGLCRAAQVAGI
jgi:hypothetical protein